MLGALFFLSISEVDASSEEADTKGQTSNLDPTATAYATRARGATTSEETLDGGETLVLAKCDARHLFVYRGMKPSAPPTLSRTL